MASTAERLGGERQGDTQSLRHVALASLSDSPTLVALYMVGVSIITLVATLLAPETYRDEIDERKARREEREEREERFTRETAAQRTGPRAQPVGR